MMMTDFGRRLPSRKGGAEMKMRLADYVADFLAARGITQCFTVTGGGAMHLNDAFGHHRALRCLYHHHEQAAAIAAEGYARVHGGPAAVCVTSGPGGTNAVTGVMGAYVDSVPMLVISGQVRYDTTARAMGLPLRAAGDQEFDITRAVACMTKYAVMLEDPQNIRYVLEKATRLATSGRPGPCWIDIPVDFQGTLIDPDALVGYDEDKSEENDLPPPPGAATVDAVLDKLAAAKRPVICAGNGLRLSGVYPLFEKLLPRLGVPAVTCWNSIDLLPTDDPLYVGRAGGMGDRAGNFAVQNADVVLSLGTRLSIRQVGYNRKTWAKNAFVIMVDVDAAELQKPTLHVELPIHADLRDFLPALAERAAKRFGTAPVWADNGWKNTCLSWKKNYPVLLPRHCEKSGLANPYFFLHTLSSALPCGAVTVAGNGTASVAGSQCFVIKEGQRFIINSGAASMGYDLPAAVGASVALGGREVICVTGDGSIQMNLQELQTILTNRLPVKIFIINNAGYHSIRQTQTAFFAGKLLVGVGPESGDLTFPSMEKLAAAYGYPYRAARSNGELQAVVAEALAEKGASITEVFVDPAQPFEPKNAAQKAPDGTLFSPPLEDLAPFLPREELAAVMRVSQTEKLNKE